MTYDDLVVFYCLFVLRCCFCDFICDALLFAQYYFTPGDTGFQVFHTKYATIGVGICWDQWFPETARALALMGAEVIFYPTAIGSEPPNPGYDSQPHWERTMVGHSAANMVPVVVSNRVGTETFENSEIKFYGKLLL